MLNFPKVAAPRGMTRCDDRLGFFEYEGNPKISNGEPATQRSADWLASQIDLSARRRRVTAFLLSRRPPH